MGQDTKSFTLIHCTSAQKILAVDTLLLAMTRQMRTRFRDKEGRGVRPNRKIQLGVNTSERSAVETNSLECNNKALHARQFKRMV